MKLSKRSRYGMRLLLDMARHYQEGPVQLSSIARRQAISVKFLEQIIIPLKKGAYVQSVRGPKGGHMLARAPDQVTVGEVVELLEGGFGITECTKNPMLCDQSSTCPTHLLWKEATEAMQEKLRATTLADLLKKGVYDQDAPCPSVSQNQRHKA